MSVDKNKEYIVDIIDNGMEGEGVAKIENMPIFIPNTIKGEKVKILIVKVNKSYAYGKAVEILVSSSNRSSSIDCETYKRCGGCNLRHVKYPYTLKMKTNIVKTTLKKALNREVLVNDIIGMEQPLYYRNKLIYPVGIENGKIVMGVFANRTHTVIPTNTCNIQDKQSQIIAQDIFEYMKANNITPYNEATCQGSVRHIIIKIGKKTNEVMVILVVKDNFASEEKFVNYITKKHNIKTIIKNINKENTNVILGKENVILYGDGYIQDILGNYKFNISPTAFYQVNPIQTEKLYNTAIELADLSKKEVVYDLYCGIGTISIFISKFVRKVYGVEIVEEAIRDAKQNAILNNAENVDFRAGDVEKVLPQVLKEELPDVVFVDPPRKGLDNATVQNLLKIKPQKIIYISCNPATLARDLKLFDKEYDIEKVQPVDMFPYTSHVECVSVLELKESTEK